MLVLCSEVIQPLSLVRCYPIGVIKMLDQGRLDEKIIAIPFQDPVYNTYHDISELPAHIFTEMTHFFTVYKSLEGKETVVDEAARRRRGAQGHTEVPGRLCRQVLQVNDSSCFEPATIDSPNKTIAIVPCAQAL